MEAFRSFIFWLLGVNDAGSIVAAHDWQWYAAAPLAAGLLLLIAALALAAAGLNLLPRAGMPWPTRLWLCGLRLAGGGLLALMVVQLEVRVTVARALPPNLAVVTDTSGSMGLQDVGGQTRLAAARAWQDTLVARLAPRARVSAYALDWQLRTDQPAAPGGSTRLMAGLADLMQREHELQGVILLTDGNDTAGDNGAAVAPLFAAANLPVYPVVFGQTEARELPRLEVTRAAEYVRLGDELTIEATLAAQAFKDQVIRAELREADVATPPAPAQEGIRLGDKPLPLSFTLKPDRPGRHTYRLLVTGLKGVASERLLVAEHVVDVIDQRIRVLLVDIPRPERKILGYWLARDPVVDLASLVLLPRGGWYGQGQLRHENQGTGLPDQEADLNQYDVVILGDIPRSYFRTSDPDETKMQWLLEFVKRRGGGLITLGGRSVYAAGQYEGSPLAQVLPLAVERTREPEVKGKLALVPTPLGFSHPIMQLERDFEANRSAWFELPKLEGANRVGAARPGATVLAVCQLPEGQMPAIACQSVGKGHVLSLAVDTTWRWELLRPRGSDADGVPEGTDYFRRFWGNAVRYLAPDPRLGPGRPQITRRASRAEVGETITLATHLVDRVYQPLRKADLTVRVTSPTGKQLRIYPCDSFSQPGVYEYPVTLDEPGTWRVTAVHQEKEVLAAIKKAEEALAKATSGGEAPVIATATQDVAAAKARIAVEELQAGDSLTELDDPRAKPAAMAEFAAATGGRAFRPEATAELLAALQLKTLHTTQTLAVPVWNLPITLALFVLIVALDCFIRKRRGLV